MKVCDVMTTSLEVGHPDTPFKELVERMLERDISGLPIVDGDGALVGIVTEADLISKPALAAPSGRQRALRFVAHLLSGQDPVSVRRAEGLTAREIMSQPVLTVHPDDDLAHAARIMLARHVKRLPVTVDGRLVGLLARPDIMRSFARPDEDIAAEVGSILADGLRVPETHRVKSEVADGVVTLTGTVQYPSDEELVVRVIGRVIGVVGVRSSIAARLPEPRVEGIHYPIS